MHAVRWEAKPLRQHCATVRGQSLHQLCRLCFARHPQAQWGLSLYSHGHVYLMIETLILMDLHHGGSSPLGQGLTLGKLHPLVPSGWSVLVFQPSWRVYTRSKPRVWGTFCRFCACWMLVLGVVSQLDDDDRANVQNL